jgi:hypothetical protein
LAVSFSGCEAEIPEALTLWPKIELGAPPVLSPDGLAAFNGVAARYPEDAKKIIGRNNELAAKIKWYNRRARDHNREIYEKIRMPKEQIDKLEPKDTNDEKDSAPTGSVRPNSIFNGYGG